VRVHGGVDHNLHHSYHSKSKSTTLIEFEGDDEFEKCLIIPVIPVIPVILGV
jgi:hypothetical protein